MRKRTDTRRKGAAGQQEDILANRTSRKAYDAMKAAWDKYIAETKSKTTWFPQYRQWIMLNRREDEGFYGGAAGGGKSDYLVVESMSQADIPNYRGLILRRTYPELEEIMDKCYAYYRVAYPKVKYNGQEHVWKFPSGAKIYLGAMQYEKDKTKYQGRQFDFIGFDELTHFTLSQYEYMRSRNRASGPGTKVYMRATGNPGGIGHGWVKSYFVTAGKPMETINTELNILTPDGSVIHQTMSRIFVPSKVFDNEILLRNNPKYLSNLAMLNEQDRKALMDGDWDIFSGQAFTEFRDNPDGYKTRRMTHVIDPFRIPEYWMIYRGFDYGYSKPFSVGWYAVDTDGNIFRIQELYGCQHDRGGNAVPDTGVKWDPTKIARKIREMEDQDPNLKGRNIIGIADPAIFEESTGESIAAMMAREGVYFQRGDHTRIAGKMQCHYRLAMDANGYAKFYVFNKCREFIRTIPSLVYDETNVEDIDTKQEDHIYDEWRYVMMQNPISPPREPEDVIHEYDPLNMYQRRE